MSQSSVTSSSATEPAPGVPTPPIQGQGQNVTTGYQGSRNNNAVLWLGDIDPEMNEEFISESFRLLNVETTYVKVIRDRDTGNPQGYAFVGFDKEETALRVLKEYNGSLIPNSGTGRKFKMNTAGKNHYKNHYQNYNGRNRHYNPGFTSPNHHHHPYHDNNQHRPKNYFSNHQNNHFNAPPNSGQPPSSGPFDGPSANAPTLSTSLYPTPSSANAPVIDTSANADTTGLPNNSSPLSTSLSTGASPGPNGPTTINVAADSGNSSGPVSGGSSVGGNTPVPSSNASTLRVDNWNPQETVTSSQGGLSTRSSQERGGGPDSGSYRPNEYTAFVGSLDYSITSETLESTFKQRYPSVSSGKVILEETGTSKGFGFVRFSSQVEYKAALTECANLPLFGGRGIRISEAHPKPPRSHYPGSINSGDGNFFRGPRMPFHGGNRNPDLSGMPPVNPGAKHGKPGPRSATSDNPNLEQQKRLARMEMIDQVKHWYPGGANHPGSQGAQQQNQGVPYVVRPPQSPNNFSSDIVGGIGRMSLSGAPIILPPEGCAPGYPGYWQQPAAAAPSYGQPIPTGYPNPLDQYTAAAGQAYWSAGTTPTGQPIYFAADPSQVYAAGLAADYSAMTSGQVPTPYPRIPYNEQTAHMFASQAMIQAAQPPPPSNNGMMGGHPGHYMGMGGGAGGDVTNIMTGPGGPTPPSDNENHGIAAGNGWGQN